jgi:hypothetical protein
VFEEDLEAETRHGMELGVAIGAPIGAIAGMSLVALAIPGLGVLALGGILAAGGVSGAVAGTLLGGFFGAISQEHLMENEWDWERKPLEPGQVLVAVDQHGHPDQVKRILQDHGGRIIAKPAHTG